MNDERSPDLTQALLLELRAQLEQARRERDEARESANIRIAALNKSRERWYARWDDATERIDRLEEQLTTEHACRMHADADLADARLSAEQGVKVAEALATEKAALLSRVVVLEVALRGLVKESDAFGIPEWDGAVVAARRALEAKQ